MTFLSLLLSIVIFPLIIFSQNLFSSLSLIILSCFLLNQVSSRKSLDYRLGLLGLQCSCLPLLLNLSYDLSFTIARTLQIVLLFLAIACFVNGALKARKIDLTKKFNFKKQVTVKLALLHNE